MRETEKLPTLYIQRTLRSGQSITSDGNIVIIGDVNPGSEIIAKGDITVWGILGGIAHAGSEGNQYARIRALKMNAIQLRIADVFARRPDNINIPYIQKTETFTPKKLAFTKNK
ncbi:MAG: septum site-determining protein MinC [Candidatus Gastranaerophilaceae bacterium]